MIMVDTNIQREDILPSERAGAYKMKYEAMKHQGSKGDKVTADAVGEAAGDSGRTVQRYIRLAEKAMDYEKTSYCGLFNFVRYIEHLQKYEVDFGEVSLSGAGAVRGAHQGKGKADLKRRGEQSGKKSFLPTRFWEEEEELLPLGVRMKEKTYWDYVLPALSRNRCLRKTACRWTETPRCIKAPPCLRCLAFLPLIWPDRRLCGAHRSRKTARRLWTGTAKGCMTKK